jgi:hypothetical protein
VPRKAKKVARGMAPKKRGEAERKAAEEIDANRPVSIPAHLREATLPERKPAEKTISKYRKKPGRPWKKARRRDAREEGPAAAVVAA